MMGGSHPRTEHPGDEGPPASRASNEKRGFDLTEYLARRWFFLLVLVGIIFAARYPTLTQQWLDAVKPRYLAGLVLFLMSVSLETRRLWEAARRPGAALLAVAIGYGLAPLLALAGSHLIPEPYRLGLIVAGCVPCSLASATIWTRMGGGNEAVSLLVTMLSNLLVFAFTPAWLAMLTGQEIGLDWWAMVGELVLYVAAPTMAGQLVRSMAPVRVLADRCKTLLSITCRLLILVIIVQSAANASSQVGQMAVADLITVAAACIGVHLILVVAGYRIGIRFFSRADAIAVAIAGSQKTLPVGMLVLLTWFEPFPLAVVPMLFYHVGQLVVDTYLVEWLFRPNLPAGKIERRNLQPPATGPRPAQE